MASNFNSSRSKENKAEEDCSIKDDEESQAFEKKGLGYLILTQSLHSLFMKYLRAGRLRAPQSSYLTELIQTFKSGAKHDRRALQSKFKSWSKRMILREPDKALVLASSGKLIIPLEECHDLVLSIHQSSKCHLTIEQVVDEVMKSYTWSRKDFGMDWDIVVDAVKNGCKDARCQKMCSLYYKGTITDNPQKKHERLLRHEDKTITRTSELSKPSTVIVEVNPKVDTQTDTKASIPHGKDTSQESDSVPVLPTTGKNPSICKGENTLPSLPEIKISAVCSLSSTEIKKDTKEPHGDSRFSSLSGIQIIPIPAVSTNASNQTPSQEIVEASNHCTPSTSSLRLYIPCTSTVTTSNVTVTKTYSHILPKVKPPATGKQPKSGSKLESNSTVEVTIQPADPSLTEGKSVLWRTLLERNRFIPDVKGIMPSQNKGSATISDGGSVSLKLQQDAALYQKHIELEARRLFASVRWSQKREQSYPLDAKAIPETPECARCRARGEMKSQAVQTSPQDVITSKRKALDEPSTELKKSKLANSVFTDAKKGYPKKAVYFIISKAKANFKRKQEPNGIQINNREPVVPNDFSLTKAEFPSTSNDCGSEKTSPHQNTLTSNSNTKKQPRKSKPRKIVFAEGRVLRSKKENVPSLEEKQRDIQMSDISANDTTGGKENSQECNTKEYQPMTEENHAVSSLKAKETMDVTMGKIVEHAHEIKSTFLQVLANEGKGKSTDVLKSKITACERLVKKLKAKLAAVNSSKTKASL